MGKPINNKNNNIIRKSPNMVRLQEIILMLKKKKYNYSSRLKLAWKLSQTKTFRNCLRKYNNVACLFTVAKYRELMKEYIARRKFTRYEKNMAVFLYKRGPKAYKWLSIIFYLPSAKSIKTLILSDTEIGPGLNENLFKQLEQKAGKMTVKGKLCVVLFDEIRITSCKKNSKRPDHALVFMLQGIAYKYKFPLAYTFSKGPISTEDLKTLIKQVIARLQKCGFNILATVCNHQKRNMRVLKELALETHLNSSRETELKHSFQVNGKEIVPIYDPAYLVKAIRNNFMKMDIEALGIFDINEVKTAKWEHVVKIYEQSAEYRKTLMPNITKKHIQPKKISKRKVKLAVHIFSRSVAAMIKFQWKDTSDIIYFYDQLFDSMNGNYYESKENPEKKLRRPVTMKSEHNKFWVKAKTILESTKFITNEGRKVRVPSVTCWLRNLKHTKYLQTKLHVKYRVKSFWMRRFSLHPMEEFFDCLVSHGYRNIKPTPSRFEEVFASLLYNGQYSKLKSKIDWTVKTPRIYNDEEDDGYFLCSVI